jgi:SAM-dependent methyltransferase
MSTFEDEWRARFERFGGKHVDEAAVSGWSPSGLRRRVRCFHSLVSAAPPGPPPVALELGCGAGTYVRLLAGLGYRAIGLDYSLPSLGRARAADPGNKGRYLAGEAYRLPCRPGTVDLVVSIGVFQALARPEAALAEIVRVLRPGGTLLLEALNRRSLAARAGWVRTKLRRLPPRVLAYDPAQMAGWLEAFGFTDVERVPVCLLPRRLPALEWVLDTPAVRRTVAVSSTVANLLAHAVWFRCRRKPVEALPA